MPGSDVELRLFSLVIYPSTWLGTAPGVEFVKVGGMNDIGVGRLRCVGNTLAWKAPRSTSFGEPVEFIPTPGVVQFLRDGDNPDKWVSVFGKSEYFIDTTVNVYLQETWSPTNTLVSDFTAAQVAAGAVNTRTIRIYNIGNLPLDDLRVWLTPLDPDVPTLGGFGSIYSMRRIAERRRGVAVIPAITGSLSSGWCDFRGVAPAAFPSRQRGNFSPFAAATAYTLQISKDNVNFYSPREETAGDVLVYSSLAPGAFSNLYVRRTIPAGMTAEPRGRTDISFSFGTL